MLREKFDLEFSLKKRRLMHLVIVIVLGEKHYCQLIGSFAPTAPAPMLSFLSVLQKKAAGSGPCPNGPHVWWKGKTVVGSLGCESPPSISVNTWEFDIALLLHVTKGLWFKTLFGPVALLLVRAFKTLSALLLLLVAPRRQEEEKVRAGAWDGARLLPRRWVRSWCCTRLSAQSSWGWRWIFMWALRDLIL